MTEYMIDLLWDDEAYVWSAVNDEIPIALESGSLDALMERVKFAVPEILTLNNLMPESKEIQLKFSAVRIERLDCNRYL